MCVYIASLLLTTTLEFGKMTIKCHLNFTWTKWGLQLQLGQIRVQLGQIRVSPLFVQMKFTTNDKITLPLHKTKQSYPFHDIFFFSFSSCVDETPRLHLLLVACQVQAWNVKNVGTLGIIVIKITHLNTSWKLFCIPCKSEGGMKPF